MQLLSNNGLFLALLSGTVLVAACGRLSSSSDTQSQLPGNPGEVPMLGMGYDKTTAKLTGIRCFEGASLEQTHAKSATVTVSKDMGYQDLQRLMAGKIGVSLPIYPGINANGSAGFASEYAKTAYSDTFTVALEASAGNKRLYLADPLASQVKLSESVQRLKQAYAQDPVAELSAKYRDSCGTDYISYAEFGASLLAVLKVDYANEYDKKAFSGSIGVEVLGGVASGSLDVGIESLKNSARARTTLMIHQRGGDPVDLLRIMTNAASAAAQANQEDPLGGFFLQCDFANRQQCIQVFKAVLKHTQDMAAKINNDDGDFQIKNAMPLYFETQAYPTSGVLRDLSVDGPQPINPAVLQDVAERLAAYRQRVAAVKGQAMADQTRVADLRAKLGVDLSKQPIDERLSAIEAAAKTAESVANTAQSACESSTTFLTVLDTVPCGDATTKAESALQYDRGALSVMPRTFYAWCILAHSQQLINIEDSLAALALMRLVGALPLDVALPETTGQAVSDLCQNTQDKLALLQDINLDFNENDPVHMLPLSSLRVIASFPKLKSVSARNQFLVSTDGLRELPALAHLDLTGNYFRSLSDFRSDWAPTAPLQTLILTRNHVTQLLDAADSSQMIVPWKTINLSDNQLSSFDDARFKAPNLVSLDLSRNDFGSVQGLLNLPKLHDVDLRETGVDDCPLANAAICTLDN